MMLRIFIGYDTREPIAFATLAQSIVKRASAPVAIIPLVQSQLRAEGIYTRSHDEKASTEFSLTRFLVPYLSGYEGTSIFMDCDMLCLTDITKISTDSSVAVSVCQHDYIPKTTVKFLGQRQDAYPRKNWSSFMVFNNVRCRMLTPGYVNMAPPLALHRLAWADEQIGSLPLEWNWLVGEYEPNPNAKVLHYTLGGPWFDPWYREAHG